MTPYPACLTVHSIQIILNLITADRPRLSLFRVARDRHKPSRSPIAVNKAQTAWYLDVPYRQWLNLISTGPSVGCPRRRIFIRARRPRGPLGPCYTGRARLYQSRNTAQDTRSVCQTLMPILSKWRRVFPISGMYNMSKSRLQ